MNRFFIAMFLIFCFTQIFIMLEAAKRKNRLTVIFMAVILGFFIVLFYLKSQFVFNVPSFVLFLSMLAAFFHTFLGEYLNFYNRFPTTFDRYLHAYGSFSAALLFYYLIMNFTDSGGSKLFNALFILFLGVGIGSIFEVFEYLMDITQKTTMQRGLKDTDTDMIANILGSVAAAVFAYYFLF